jgi:hypothetical protein
MPDRERREWHRKPGIGRRVWHHLPDTGRRVWCHRPVQRGRRVPHAWYSDQIVTQKPGTERGEYHTIPGTVR